MKVLIVYAHQESKSFNGAMRDCVFHINHGMLYFVGFEVLPSFIAWAPARVGDVTRAEYPEQYKERLMSLETTPTIPYPKLAEYDENFELKTPLK